jgi:hypothetical protein
LIEVRDARLEPVDGPRVWVASGDEDELCCERTLTGGSITQSVGYAPGEWLVVRLHENPDRDSILGSSLHLAFVWREESIQVYAGWTHISDVMEPELEGWATIDQERLARDRVLRANFHLLGEGGRTRWDLFEGALAVDLAAVPTEFVYSGRPRDPLDPRYYYPWAVSPF